MDTNELARLRTVAEAATLPGNYLSVTSRRQKLDNEMDPPTVLALLAEVERLRDTEKAQGAMIRELEDENAELNDELGTAVQVLKLERDGLRARLAAVEAVCRLDDLTDEEFAAFIKAAKS